MTLRNQTRAMIALTVIAMTLVLFLISDVTIRYVFDNLQEQFVKDRVASVLGKLADDRDNLNAITADWAIWDDAYAFMENRDPAFLESNLQTSVMTNLHLSALVLLDTTSHVVASLGYDLDAGKEVPVSPALLEALKPGSKLITHANPHDSVAGFLALSEGPVLLASRPIATSSYGGPIRGTLIFARLMGPSEIRRLTEIAGARSVINIHTVQETNVKENWSVQRTAGWSLAGNVTVASIQHKEFTVGLARLTDINGQASIDIEAKVDNRLRAESLRLLKVLAFLLLVVGLSLGAAQSVLFDRKVVSRVQKLSGDVISIGGEGYPSGNVEVSGQDELTRLATAINSMLDALRQADMTRRHNERFLESVFDSIQDGICVLDMDLNIVRVNSWMERTFAASAPLIGKKCYVAFQCRETPCENCVARQTHDTFECHRQILPFPGDSPIKWIDASTYPLWSGTGEMTGIIEYIRDVTDQKRIHAELIESTEKWERTFNAVPDLIMILDEEHRILRVNKAMADRIATTCENCTGSYCHYLVHGTDTPMPGCPHTRLIEDGFPHGVELHDDRLGGDFIITVTPLFDAQNKIIGGVHVARDVTEYKKAIEAARLSQSSYEAFLDAVNDVILVLDQKTERILDVNNKFELMFGYTRDQARTLTLKNLEADSSHLQQDGHSWFEAAASGDVHLYEWQAMHRDGHTFWVETNGQQLSQGGQSRIFASIRDITMRRREHEELLRIRSALDDCGSAVFIIDNERNALYFNSAFGALFGFVQDEASKAFLPFGNEITGQDIYGAVLGGLSWQGEIEMIGRAGRRFPALLRATPVLDNDYDVIGAMFILNDVTASKYLEAQLLQAQNMKSIGQLAAGIAHEINTPMQYVGDNTRFLRDNFKALLDLIEGYERLLATIEKTNFDPTALEALDQVRKAADIDFMKDDIPVAIRQSMEGIDRVIEIVRAMRQLTHPGTKERSMIDLNLLVESSVTITRNEWKYVADMETHLNFTMPMVPCFPNDLSQVLLNLIINASHAIAAVRGEDTAHKGRITITTSYDGSFAEIRVADTGGGIPETIRERIFDPFFTTKAVGKGTGQGLAISHAIVVEKHGGTLTFETEVGQGATFIIRIPLRDETIKKG